jgi:hypothetical protein
MYYPDGQEIRLGDELELWDGCIGSVVCSIDTEEYTRNYPKGEWEYLKKGVVIVSKDAGLIHYTDPDPNFRLIARRQL